MNEIPRNPRVVVLGGAGGMGRVAVATAAAFGDIGELVVSDLDLSAAELVVSEFAPMAKTRMRASSVDVRDDRALVALLSQADVVLNTTGPFFLLGVPVLRAAIEAGCHYIDICDDWEPTLDMLELDGEARSRGVLAVIGMGASPGLSNLLARIACERLERVEDLYTAWPVDGGNHESDGEEASTEDETIDGASAAIVHWMQQISGQIQAVEAGEIVTRPPLVPVKIDFPGFGSGTAYTVGHPEPITLREGVAVQGSSASVMLLKSYTAAFLSVLRDDIDSGRVSIEAAAEQVFAPSVGQRMKALFRSSRYANSGRLPFFFALARGIRENQRVTVGVRVTALPKGMDGATGIPLALGLRQILDGRLRETGVHPPEIVIDPKMLFDALATSCTPSRNGLGDLIVVTEN